MAIHNTEWMRIIIKLKCMISRKAYKKKVWVHKKSRHQVSCATQTRLVFEHSVSNVQWFCNSHLMQTIKNKKKAVLNKDDKKYLLTRNLTTPERNNSLVEPKIIKQQELLGQMDGNQVSQR